MNTTRRLAVLLALSSLALVTNVRAQAPAADAPKPPKATMGSTVINWDKLEVKTTKTGARREVFDAPTATLNNFECHVTTLNPGEIPHQPHRHPDEEMIVIKEGTLEVTINGQSQRAGPGSIFFYGFQRSARHEERRHDAGDLLRLPLHHAKDAARPAGRAPQRNNRPRRQSLSLSLPLPVAGVNSMPSIMPSSWL